MPCYFAGCGRYISEGMKVCLSEGAPLQRHLLLLAQGKFEYGKAEAEAVANSFGACLRGKWESNESAPVQVLHSVPEQVVRKLMSRSVLCKSAFELWGSGRDYDQLRSSISEYPDKFKAPFFAETKTFAVRVKGLGRKLPSSQQGKRIDDLESVLPFQGKVKLEDPDAQFYILEDYTKPGGSRTSTPRQIYFCRLLCDAQRGLFEKYSLKQRKFIGNTSMDPMLGLAMANFACAAPGKLVCDPFVGTGSLLISAAHYGAYVVGADISYNILHARGKSSRKDAGWRKRDETIRHSLAEYGLDHCYVDVLLADAARHPWRAKRSVFDAIVTDPPYGIREACSRIGSKKEGVVVPELGEGLVHFPEQTAYHLDEIFTDLLDFAARFLVERGRLVFWLPVYRSDYTPAIVPSHPALTLVHNCEQVLNSHSSRRLIVMEKARDASVGRATIAGSVYSGHNAFRNRYFNQT